MSGDRSRLCRVMFPTLSKDMSSSVLCQFRSKRCGYSPGDTEGSFLPHRPGKRLVCCGIPSG